MDPNKLLRLLDVAFRTEPDLLKGDSSKANKRALSVVSGLDESVVDIALQHISNMIKELKEGGFTN